jgi:ABC-2 type transport system ATP-binding protein
MITMENVCKSYRVAKRNAGFGAACKALFHREYEVIEALKDISFTIGNGEMVGYIGPNGAGKSSTIKILSGILTPDRGKVSIDGRNLWNLDKNGRNRNSRGERYRRIDHVRQIGVVFGQRSQLWWDVPVIDSYELLRDIYSIPAKVYQNNLEELTESLALTELLRTPARQLSLGQRMRCEIAASLLHSPGILFLDEPTIGLDAVSKLAVRDFVRKLNREHGTTVILTTHDMQDIEALASRIILIGKGRILMDGTLEDIRRGDASMDETLAQLYKSYEIT